MARTLTYTDLADWHNDMCDTVEILCMIQIAMEETEGATPYNRALLGAYHSMQQMLDNLQRMYDSDALKVVG